MGMDRDAGMNGTVTIKLANYGGMEKVFAYLDSELTLARN